MGVLIEVPVVRVGNAPYARYDAGDLSRARAR